jgi:hypothetical protein
MIRLATLPPLSVIVLGLCSANADDRLLFNRDIRPLLSENCFACHGPDEHERKAKMRLDIRDGGAFEKRDGITAIIPGNPGESEIMFRLTTEDKDEVMPPPKSGKKLKPAEIALIKKWIAAGAEYQGHWSFSKPTKPKVTQGSHPIDHFIDKKLATSSLKLATPAEAHTLIRRISLDLTGILPTPEEVSDFSGNYSNDPATAIQATAKRLLTSPRYGERMAAFWLDLVRYADSIGYHSDTNMDVYLYREWVINAFNANQPFDQFTREQIAGDLLPEASVEQKIASGYNRLLQTTEEGGAQAKEYITIYAADRVRNVSGAWMGGTLGCAQCHDHKYDPYTSKDFYSMAAFFADIKENAVGKRAPGMPAATGQHKKRIADLDKKIADLTKSTLVPSPEIKAAQEKWEKSVIASSKPALGIWRIIGPIPGGDPTKAFNTEFGPEKGINPKAVIAGKKWQEGPNLTDGKVHDLGTNANSAWYLYRTINAAVATQLPVSLGSDDGIRAWLNGHEQLKNNTARGAAADQEKLTLELRPGHNHFLMKIVNHGGGAGFYFKAAGNELPLNVITALKSPPNERSEEQKKGIEQYYLGISPALADARTKIAAAEQEKVGLQKNLPRTLVSVSMKPRDIRILPRGNWLDDSGEIVQPAIPKFLGKLETGEKRATRIDLANWLISAENPMTARTFVNRLWKLFFGNGLAKNVDDLGSQGQWPSHPELLDWLAVEFVASGWNIQHMIELIVTSRAYSQSSRSSPGLRERDPLNALLARQSSFRVDAEMVRDNALTFGAILTERLGGRSNKPYQPAGYWRHLNFPARKYAHDAGENQYRRALYTHWQRSFLHPSLLAFDAPSREECTAERPRSNTPLQALVLLNDITYVEAARAFAERIIREGGKDPTSRINWAMNIALSRNGNAQEVKLLGDLQSAQQKRYIADEKSAAEFNTVGLRPPPKDIPAVELASWTAIARTLINLHETITRY